MSVVICAGEPSRQADNCTTVGFATPEVRTVNVCSVCLEELLLSIDFDHSLRLRNAKLRVCAFDRVCCNGDIVLHCGCKS